MFRVGQDILSTKEVIVTFIIDIFLLILDYWFFTRSWRGKK